MYNFPQTKNDLKNYKEIQITLITHFHARENGELLKTVEQLFPIPLDTKQRTMLNWAVKDKEISYNTAMEAMLMTWLEELAEDRQVYEDLRREYPELPEFWVSFHAQKEITWVKQIYD